MVAPKRGKSSFMFFGDEHRKGLLDSGMKIGDAAKELGKRWKALSDKDKDKYVKKAETDKKRYEKEVEQWKKDHPGEKLTKPRKKKGKGDAEADGESKKEKKPRKKRSLTGYNLFSKEMNTKLKGDGMKQSEIMKEAGKRWKELKDDEKEKYNSKAKKLANKE